MVAIALLNADTMRKVIGESVISDSPPPIKTEHSPKKRNGGKLNAIAANVPLTSAADYSLSSFSGDSGVSSETSCLIVR